MKPRGWEIKGYEPVEGHPTASDNIKIAVCRGSRQGWLLKAHEQPPWYSKAVPYTVYETTQSVV
jgi:hypothetical protein